MSEELCEHGKKYPCCDCTDPCIEELKRREFYEQIDPCDPDIDEDWGDDDY